MSKIMKRFLAISLTVLMMLSMVSVFAEGTEGEDASTGTEVPGGASAYVVNENFNDGDVSQWGEDAVFSSSDYGYLEFTATEANGILTRQWDNTGATELTVDFRIKAVTEGENATVSLNVAGAALTLTPASDTLCWGAENAGIATIIPKLWYDVRVAIKDNEEQNAKVANVWVDGKAYDTTIAVDAISDSFTATLANGETIGIDDFKVYREYKNDGLKSTALDFKFDGFEFTNSHTTAVEKGGTLVDPVIVPGENTKHDNNTFGKSNTVGGSNTVFGLNFDKNVNIIPVSGKFGKSADDKSIYYSNNGEGASAVSSDSSLEFSFGKNGYLPNSGDKQVISFNMAFVGSAPADMIVRSFNMYNTGSDPAFLGGKAGSSSSVTGNDGWLMRIMGDRMYLFSGTTYYSIAPALLPDVWNNFRLELTSGEAPFNSSSADVNAMYISAYVNDIAVAENVAIPASKYYTRNTGSTAANRGRFKGIHRLTLNYNYSTEGNTEKGFYFDDIKVENYYSGADCEDVKSPLLKDSEGTLGIEESDLTLAAWNNDKWVQGSTVYVDGEKTLKEFSDNLLAERNKGITFRNSDGEIIENLEQKISVLTDINKPEIEIYADIIREDFSRVYVGLMNKSYVHTDIDGSDASVFNSWNDDNVNKWEYNNVAVTSEDGIGAKPQDDKVYKLTYNSSNASNNRIKYSFMARPSRTTYAYAEANDFRPFTVETSVLMESGSTLKMGFWDAQGPSGGYYNANGVATAVRTSGFEVHSIYFENGHITGRNFISSANEKDNLGTYNVGEWNRVTFSMYPGYPQYRMDISVNGKKVIERLYIRKERIFQALPWLVMYNTGDVYLDDMEIYTGYYDAPETPALVSGDNDIVIEKDTKSIVLKDSKTKAELLNALADSSVDEILGVYKTRSYVGENVTVADTDLLSVGNIVAIQKGEIIEYYEIAENKFTFKQGSAEIAGDLTEGTKINVSAYARSATAKLIVAQYDANRKLVEDGITIADASSGVAKANSVEVKAGAKIVKAMLWDGFANIAPELVSEERNVIEAPVAEETE